MENLDFARLRYEGENHPYTGHPAARSSMPELYYLLLMTILTSAEANKAQWMHLYRVAKGAGYAQDVRELLPSAHSITDEKIVECVESIRRDNLTNAFLLDAMLLYLLREEENAKLLEYIAGLCVLLEVAPPVITETIAVAKCIIEQDHTHYLKTISETSTLCERESNIYLQEKNDAYKNFLDLSLRSETRSIIIKDCDWDDILLQLDKWNGTEITFLHCDCADINMEGINVPRVSFQDCDIGDVVLNTCKTATISLQDADIGNVVLNHCKAEEILFHDCSAESTILNNCTVDTFLEPDSED